MTPPPENQIIEGNCTEQLATLPSDTFDVVFADPPYNLQLQGDLWRPNHTQVDAVNDDWDQFDNFSQYDQFTGAWLQAVRRVMKPTATIWVSGTYHNIFRVGSILHDLGFWILNTVTWHKTNAMPNFRGTRLKNDVEFVIWAKYTEASRYTFNHHKMKRFNDGKQLGSVWQIPACGGSERLRLEDGSKLHATQKPKELLQRIILASSHVGDFILDPFSGTGTTAAVAKHLRRRWLGIEMEPDYVAASRERLALIKPLDSDDSLLKMERDTPKKRVPFRSLIQKGYLQVGQSLYFDQPQVTAIIEAGGKLRVNGDVGSIHQLGALLKNAPSCNGWMHWYYDDPATGKRKAIDEIRQRMRSSDVEG